MGSKGAPGVTPGMPICYAIIIFIIICCCWIIKLICVGSIEPWLYISCIIFCYCCICIANIGFGAGYYMGTGALGAGIIIGPYVS